MKHLLYIIPLEFENFLNCSNLVIGTNLFFVVLGMLFHITLFPGFCLKKVFICIICCCRLFRKELDEDIILLVFCLKYRENIINIIKNLGKKF